VAARIEAQIPYVDAALDRIVLRYDQTTLNFGIETHRVAVLNGRAAAQPPSLEQQGFMLARQPSPVVRQRFEQLVRENSAPRELQAPVNIDYMAELVPLIEKLSGAREVIAQYDTITVRFSGRASRKSWMTTAAFAHMDFVPSEVDRILNETLNLTGRSIRPFRRQVMFQTWRVITEPPQDKPLALCDERTATAADEVPLEFHGPPGSRNELVRSRGCRFSPRHQWYYFPDMSPDDLLVFKGYDSARPESMNVVHTAFDDQTAMNPVPRGSIECRYLALYD
jgi:hypothetical protein